MSILIQIQFSCDGDGCRRMKSEFANPTTANQAMDKFAEANWTKKGRKCFCPECSREQISNGGEWQQQIGG